MVNILITNLSVLALKIGNIEICTEMVKGVANSDSRIKGMYLRTLMTNSVIYGSLITNILKNSGSLILSWINENVDIELDTDEQSRILATIMKVLGSMDWFDPDNPGQVSSAKFSDLAILSIREYLQQLIAILQDIRGFYGHFAATEI